MVNHAQDLMSVKKFLDLPNKLIPIPYITGQFYEIIIDSEHNYVDDSYFFEEMIHIS